MYMNENGVRFDEVEELDEWCKGDFNAVYADDEEQNIVLEQKKLDNLEEEMVNRSSHYNEDFDEDDEDDEDDSSDEDEKEDLEARFVTILLH